MFGINEITQTHSDFINAYEKGPPSFRTVDLFLNGCGDKIRTCDLQVMRMLMVVSDIC